MKDNREPIPIVDEGALRIVNQYRRKFGLRAMKRKTTWREAIKVTAQTLASTASGGLDALRLLLAAPPKLRIGGGVAPCAVWWWLCWDLYEAWEPIFVDEHDYPPSERLRPAWPRRMLALRNAHDKLVREPSRSHLKVAQNAARKVSKLRYMLPRPSRMTNPTIDAADRFIRAKPGVFGKEVAVEIEVSYDHFRRMIVPALKARGVVNRRPGYFPPD